MENKPTFRQILGIEEILGKKKGISDLTKKLKSTPDQILDAITAIEKEPITVNNAWKIDEIERQVELNMDIDTTDIDQWQEAKSVLQSSGLSKIDEALLEVEEKVLEEKQEEVNKIKYISEKADQLRRKGLTDLGITPEIYKILERAKYQTIRKPEDVDDYDDQTLLDINRNALITLIDRTKKYVK